MTKSSPLSKPVVAGSDAVILILYFEPEAILTGINAVIVPEVFEARLPI